jgi:hypothetical protein
MHGNVPDYIRQGFCHVLGKLLDRLVVPQYQYSRKLEHKDQAGVIYGSVSFALVVGPRSCSWNFLLDRDHSR